MTKPNYETRCFECEKIIDEAIYRAKMTVGVITDTGNHVWVHFHIACFNGLAGDEWFFLLKTKWENRFGREFIERFPDPLAKEATNV